MWVIAVLIIILAVILTESNKRGNKEIEQKKLEGQPDANVENLSNYQTNKYVMTQTELIFYRKLKEVTDRLEMNIFPQVHLERFIKTKDGKYADRNRIKSRSVDYCIVNNKNCKVICCVELDDSSHYKENVKKDDEFKNRLFEKVGIPLYRVKVVNDYKSQLIEIENKIKGISEKIKQNDYL